MSRNSDKAMKHSGWIYLLSTLIFGVAVLLFFALAYPHHLHFQEQYQLFMFNKGYVLEVLAVPGGVADLLGRFLTQFFLYAWVGASLIALVMVGIQLLTYRLLQNVCSGHLNYALSFIPAIISCCFLCDENALMTAPAALTIVLGGVLAVQSISKDNVRQVIEIASIPLVYMMAGAFVLLYAVILIITEVQKRYTTKLLPVVGGILLVASLSPAIWHHFVHYSLMQLYVGPHYYRITDVFPIWAWGAVATVPLLMLLSKILSRWSIRRTLTAHAILWTMLMLIGGDMVYSSQSQQQESIMAYDFMARNAMWNRIIQKAQQKAPKNQVAAVALNLALAERGMLTSHLFEYPQNGISGLLPSFTRDYVSPLVTSEVLYRLGMINTAQCFVFEAQEAIPDFQKSARCYKRLAETNLINGAYEVARKYLIALQNTLFYRAWATETLALIADGEAVNKHPEYGSLRKMRSNQNYFFGGTPLHQILSTQLEANPQNRIAFEYLEAACMLVKDVERATSFYSLSEPLGYQGIPRNIQQAMLLNWSQNHKINEPIPEYFQPDVVQEFKSFFSALQSSNGNPKSMQTVFGNTYWFYYYFHK